MTARCGMQARTVQNRLRSKRSLSLRTAHSRQPTHSQPPPSVHPWDSDVKRRSKQDSKPFLWAELSTQVAEVPTRALDEGVDGCRQIRRVRSPQARDSGNALDRGTHCFLVFLRESCRWVHC